MTSAAATENKVAVLGAGAWGTALAKVLADKGDVVQMYCRRPELVDQINREHVNGKYLPSAKLPGTLTASVDPDEVLSGASMVVFVAPSHATREVAKLVARKVPHDAPIVSATKGIENDSLTFIDEILAAELSGDTHRHFSFLSGPSFAKELAAEQPTGVVIASPPRASESLTISASPRVMSMARVLCPKPRPSAAPAAMAMTFLIAPPHSTPGMSRLA